ncbi:hypothetical protein AGLY_013981 [Aphis glycines]|uniref:Uncharacterized protein n=1 Tax=Aphis glycines TaxID=307491 RepID=A0A6G0T5E8_APHGL|nr:hypothetical protein AGLY_013981 [Aphis glycines]
METGKETDLPWKKSILLSKVLLIIPPQFLSVPVMLVYKKKRVFGCFSPSPGKDSKLFSETISIEYNCRSRKFKISCIYYEADLYSPLLLIRFLYFIIVRYLLCQTILTTFRNIEFWISFDYLGMDSLTMLPTLGVGLCILIKYISINITFFFIYKKAMASWVRNHRKFPSTLIKSKKSQQVGTALLYIKGWGGPRTRIFEEKFMENLVPNFQNLVIKEKIFMIFQLQNDLQIFAFSTDFVAKKCLLKVCKYTSHEGIFLTCKR